MTDVALMLLCSLTIFLRKILFSILREITMIISIYQQSCSGFVMFIFIFKKSEKSTKMFADFLLCFVKFLWAFT